MRLLDRKAAIVAGPYGRMGERLEGLRMTFSISKSIGSAMNRATITVVNGSPRTRCAIETRGNALTLLAGYGDSLGVLYCGEVFRATTRREGPDIITEVECRDGLSALRSATVSRTYAAGTPKRVVVYDLVAALARKGLSRGVVEDSQAIRGIISDPITLAGSVRRALDYLAEAWGFRWSVQDGVVEIREVGRARPGWRLAPLISPRSGMVGYPQRTERGIKATCLLLQAINPGARFRLESAELSGLYQATAVSHRGDTHGGDWLTEIEAVEAK